MISVSLLLEIKLITVAPKSKTKKAGPQPFFCFLCFWPGKSPFLQRGQNHFSSSFGSTFMPAQGQCHLKREQNAR